jgi:hypothetical protein
MCHYSYRNIKVTSSMSSSSDLFCYTQPLSKIIRTTGILDLSQYQYEIVIQTSFINESDWVRMLRLYDICVHTVILDGHKELYNLTFSRLRHCLPFLKTIQMKEISGEQCNIDGKQFVQMYAKGITIICDPSLQCYINVNVNRYLNVNQQSVISTYTTAQCIYALSIETERRRVQTQINLDKYKVRQEQEELALSTLIKEWKEEIKTNKEDPWVVGAPTIESPGLVKMDMSKEILILYILVTKLKLWDEVKKGPGDMGYMFSCPPSLDVVANHPAVAACGHSGASFGFAMRIMEGIAIKGSYKAWEEGRESS